MGWLEVFQAFKTSDVSLYCIRSDHVDWETPEYYKLSNKFVGKDNVTKYNDYD